MSQILHCIFLLISVDMYRMGACMTEHVWQSEDNLWEPVVFFHQVDPRDSTQVVRLGSKYFCQPLK